MNYLKFEADRGPEIKNMDDLICYVFREHHNAHLTVSFCYRNLIQISMTDYADSGETIKVEKEISLEVPGDFYRVAHELCLKMSHLKLEKL